MYGFASGTIGESIAISLTGAGLSAKIGNVLRGILAASKAGSYALTALSDLKKATEKISKTLLQLGRKETDLAALRVIGDFLGKTELPSGKRASEVLATAFKDNPVSMDKVVRELDADWNDIPETRKYARMKISLLRMAQVADLLGDRVDDPQMLVNFLKLYKSKLFLKPEVDSDAFDWYAASFHSHSYRGAPEGIDDAARDLMAAHIKDPNAGSTWKVGFAGPQPRSTFARANLVELDAALNGKYKNSTWLDRLEGGDNEGIDFITESGALVQQTSTASGSPNLVQKLRNAANAALDQGGPGCDFVFDVYWLESNGIPNLTDLSDEAMNLEQLLGITIRIDNTSIPFKDWIP